MIKRYWLSKESPRAVKKDWALERELSRALNVC
jgi:hypothetical protein